MLGNYFLPIALLKVMKHLAVNLNHAFEQARAHAHAHYLSSVVRMRNFYLDLFSPAHFHQIVLKHLPAGYR